MIAPWEGDSLLVRAVGLQRRGRVRGARRGEERIGTRCRLHRASGARLVAATARMDTAPPRRRLPWSQPDDAVGTVGTMTASRTICTVARTDRGAWFGEAAVAPAALVQKVGMPRDATSSLPCRCSGKWTAAPASRRGRLGLRPSRPWCRFLGHWHSSFLCKRARSHGGAASAWRGS